MSKRKKIVVFISLFLLIALIIANIVVVYNNQPENLINLFRKAESVISGKYIVDFYPTKVEFLQTVKDLIYDFDKNSLLIDYKGLKIKANLSSLFPEENKVGIRLKMYIENLTGNKLTLNTTNVLLGYKGDLNQYSFLPHLIQNSSYPLNVGKKLELNLVYYPENNIYTLRKYGYYGDLRETYFLDLSSAILMNNLKSVLPIRIYFSADKKDYSKYKKVFSKENIYTDYVCRLTFEQLSLLKSRKIIFYQDQIGTTFINEQVPLSLNAFEHKGILFVRIKIPQGNLIIDEKDISVSYDGTTWERSINKFKDLSTQFKKMLISPNVLNLDINYPFEYTFKFKAKNTKKIYLDLSGIVLKIDHHDNEKGNAKYNEKSSTKYSALVPIKLQLVEAGN
ncbi:hypothetical protein Calkro_2178 [Caldicellulosiruptor kronotskyensis 2002]|uniref:Uncharacterized protein n=1 Tax=Caldicellulosiruptor kronotskyensis (strain DSM 18902 / VKM B-2412 / 2002) TaxID=632348 RepID=E4SGZ1_CALK2|nr:hypothetical protein [Caldicellulosiruptor kronotskyensis]ADQ47016.1 hypothetical protein Calkro_2178 [Caldicellulosiruptor kronotskyensis 2002]